MKVRRVIINVLVIDGDKERDQGVIKNVVFQQNATDVLQFDAPSATDERCIADTAALLYRSIAGGPPTRPEEGGR